MDNNRREKEYTEGISVKGGLAGKLDNFWYHHKWTTLMIGFFVIVAIICTAQMCNKEADDLTVVYAGRHGLKASEISNIGAVLSNIAPEDFDGDGRKSIAVSAYNIMSQAQIEEMAKQTDAAGNNVHVDKSFFTNEYSTYNNYIKTGESSILFLDEWEYDELVKHGMLMRLDEVLDSVPEGAVGEYGVRLGDTDLYSYYSVMQLLPEDTVVCILRPFAIGKSSKEKYYEREEKMFCAIVTFDSGEEQTED